MSSPCTQEHCFTSVGVREVSRASKSLTGQPDLHDLWEEGGGDVQFQLAR